MKFASDKRRQRPAWQFIPSLEFVNGFIHDIAGGFLAMIFKTLGGSNQLISIGWLLQLPLTLKALWAPIVERMGTHRSNLLRSLSLSIVCIFVLSGVFFFFGSTTFAQIAGVFFVMMLIMSVLEISVKGYKISALNVNQIQLYAGISTAFYRLGMIFGSSLLVYLVGWLEGVYRPEGLDTPQIASYATAWGIIFGGSGLLSVLLAIYLYYILPYPIIDKQVTQKLTLQSYGNVFLGYLKQNGGVLLLAFLFLSRFGEGIFKSMWTPFSLDPVADGGLAVDLKILGVMAPGGSAAIVIGGIVGSILVRWLGAQRSLLWLYPLMFLPNLIYSYLALVQPTDLLNFWGVEIHSWLLIGGMIEVFCYAMAFAPIVVTVDLFAKNAGMHKATFAAISTSFLLMGFVVGGGTGGFIEAKVGYFWLFNISALVSLPAYVLAFFLPLAEVETEARAVDKEAGMDEGSL